MSRISKVFEDSTRSGFYLTVGSFLSLLFSTLTGFFIARILGPEVYGLYSLSTSFPLFLTTIVSMGLKPSIMKFSASLKTDDVNRLRSLLIHSLIFQTLSAMIAFVLCFTFSNQLSISLLKRPEVTEYLRIASLVIIFSSLSELVGAMFIGLDRTEFNTLRVIVHQSTRILLSPTLLLLGFGVAGALTGNILSFLLSFFFALSIFYFYIFTNLKTASQYKERYVFSDSIKMLMRYGFPLYLSSLISASITQFTHILLANFATNYEIGNYSAAYNFVTVLNTLTISITSTLLPAFSKLEKNEKEARDFVRISTKYLSIMYLPIVFLLLVNSKEIIQIIYGTTYDLAQQYLILSLLQHLLIGFGGIIISNFFNGIGETKINLKLNIIFIGITVILAPILSWKFGIVGIIVTSLLANIIVQSGLKLYIAKRKFKIELNQKVIIRVYLVLVASAVIVLPFQSMVVSNIVKVTLVTAIYLTVYLVLLPLVKIISPSEFRKITSIVNKVTLLRRVLYPFLYFMERTIKTIEKARKKRN